MITATRTMKIKVMLEISVLTAENEFAEIMNAPAAGTESMAYLALLVSFPCSILLRPNATPMMREAMAIKLYCSDTLAYEGERKKVS